MDDYIMKGKLLGEGTFAQVRAAIQSSTGKTVAIKTYNRLKITKAENLKAIARETDLLSRVESPYVVRFIEKVENSRNIHVVMEFGGKLHLLDYMKTKEFMQAKPSDLKLMMRNMVIGLNHIHAQGVLHRDLKLENIVVSNMETPKIADFGFAREKSAKMGVCGTLYYMSPELFGSLGGHNSGTRSIQHSEKSDVWSLGVIFYYMVAKKYPFNGSSESEIKKEILEKKVDFEDVESDMIEVILQMLDKDLHSRPDCSSLLEETSVLMK